MFSFLWIALGSLYLKQVLFIDPAWLHLYQLVLTYISQTSSDSILDSVESYV